MGQLFSFLLKQWGLCSSNKRDKTREKPYTSYFSGQVPPVYANDRLGVVLMSTASTIALRDLFDASLVIFLFAPTWLPNFALAVLTVSLGLSGFLHFCKHPRSLGRENAGGLHPPLIEGKGTGFPLPILLLLSVFAFYVARSLREKHNAQRDEKGGKGPGKLK